MNVDLILILIIISLYIVMFVLRLKNRNKYFLLLSFAIFYLVLVVREPISDMIIYLNGFNRITNLEFAQLFSVNWEILYVLLNKIIGLVTEHDRIFIVITSFIGLIGPYYFIKNYSKNYLISVLLFIILGLFSYHFFVIRQTIAISIILLSIKYIKEKKLIKFLIVITIATFFHTSACIFVIAYFICNTKITNMHIIIVVAILLGCFVLKSYLVNLIYQLQYIEYVNSSSISDGYQRLLLFIIILLFVTAFYIKLNNEKENDNNEDGSLITISYNLVWLTTLFQILATEQSIVSRIACMFAYGIILIIPNLISGISDKNMKTLLNTSIVFMSILYAILFPTILDYSTMF